MASAPEPAPAAVSSVVGTVLMLGITMAVFAAFSLVVIDQVTDEAGQAVRAELDVDQQDGRLLLRHRGGEPLELADGTLHLLVEGNPVERPLADLADQVADGHAWHLGESLCLAGPQPPCLYQEGQVEDVRIAYAGELAFSGLGAATVTPPVATYVAAATATAGTVVALANAQSATDGGAEAVLQELGTIQSPSTVGPFKSSGTALATGGAVDPLNVAASDSQVAQLDATGDVIEVQGFGSTLPTDATITAVTIGYEGRKDAGGGTSPTTRLDYKVASGAYSLGPSLTESATTDTDRTRSLCTTQATCAALAVPMTVANVQAMTVRVFHVADTNRNPLIDHVFVAITYSSPTTMTYALDVRMDFAGVPAAGSHLLQLDYRVADDTFQVQVWDGAAFVPRGATLDATSTQSWSYALTTGEYNAGAPRLRFVDLTPTGTVQGNLFLGHVRVVGS